MYFEGNEEVLSNLFRKKRLLTDGDLQHQAIKPAILICGGTMRGVYGGGGTIALEKAGLTNVFDVAVGVSTGSPVLGYFLAGHVEKNLSVYWEECITKNFLSKRRFVTGGPVVDTDWLCKVFRGEVSSKKLNQEVLIRSRTSFHTAVTCADTGDGVLLDAKTLPDNLDVVEAIRASIALPGLSRGVVTIGGKRYVDGAGGFPFPATKIIREFKPTDLLIFANCPESEFTDENILQPLIVEQFLSTFTPPLREVFANINKTALRDIEATRAQKKCRVAIIWSDEKIGSFEMNGEKLKAAAMDTQERFAGLLTKAKREAEITTTTLIH